ncbi:exported hypothetical protein [Candidatus Sulfopaludibacter sp. SbA3]|nr:exported hypothetical protein [Candidatus Sulfopaludibacter sp. SbA3]
MPAGLRVSALLFFAASTAAAQQEPHATIRITVTLVQVDAVVTDSSGRHVPGLGPGDFEIRQDGEVQKPPELHPGTAAAAATPAGQGQSPHRYPCPHQPATGETHRGPGGG